MAQAHLALERECFSVPAASLGLTLACLSGLRCTAPLFVFGLLALKYPDHVEPAVDWASSHWFVVFMGVLLAVELILDKIPFVDHGLHVLLLLAAPAAGAAAVYICGGYCDDQKNFMLIVG